MRESALPYLNLRAQSGQCVPLVREQRYCTLLSKLHSDMVEENRVVAYENPEH
jgi:hypothetical protein